ncbi:phosphatidylinositol N-acetylglucosaminyltransferase subunit GPI1-like [Andrographis paniculata]|uniref:phosphatidylinositol N-acetylglucosaminyltransferase subunit GPI1-like n=1 Tax=Andrographis paniculata TaxID=175694 RepID=UPI0021E92DB7|nr:phosphatidylinositol N-acetylglucosaminyltransferase subunit GPI1-like [Andrographis paniculata]
MGNPAGFKLNTELAGVLGVISLNAIQIWSTLWIFVGSLVVHFTKVLAICGIAFGLTSAAAIIIDMISLVTMHVWTIHLFLSLVYSTQIQAIASLWRLFRGKKWNPLRHRMDSYDYTVEQHVVGSLMFTPILLLLPTISVFYIFFTMLHTSVRFFCILIEATISIIHSTPYAKILLWLGRRKRFPSGIWFEVISCISETGSRSGRNGILEEKKASAFNNGEPTILVSFLHSNYLNLGEVVWPHYSYLLSAFSRSSIGSCAYGLLTGRRAAALSPLPSFPQKLQWMAMPWKEYWKLSYDSVLLENLNYKLQIMRKVHTRRSLIKKTSSLHTRRSLIKKTSSLFTVTELCCSGPLVWEKNNTTFQCKVLLVSHSRMPLVESPPALKFAFFDGLRLLEDSHCTFSLPKMPCVEFPQSIIESRAPIFSVRLNCFLQDRLDFAVGDFSLSIHLRMI